MDDGETQAVTCYFTMKQVNPLVVARTEHVMSLVYGVPTILGRNINLE